MLQKFFSRNQLLALGVGWMVTTAVHPALAHHAMGNSTPANVWEGLLSGLAHPLIGLDHLAAVVAIGLLCAGLKRGIFLPITFLLTANVGTTLHLLRLDLSFAELAIALSVLTLGLLLLLGQRLNPWLLGSLAAIAGIFHGYAYGESMTGAGLNALLGYLIGLSLSQYGIALMAYKLKDWSDTQQPRWALRFRQLSGIAIALIGLGFLVASA
uniref:HupE/UreJ protein n=1 Tax=Cyanothece sp. (strain PCC 7425 / ATCC 29141) TaxID=395961 RepID=B8HP89_CYAP4